MIDLNTGLIPPSLQPFINLTFIRNFYERPRKDKVMENERLPGAI